MGNQTKTYKVSLSFDANMAMGKTGFKDYFPSQDKSWLYVGILTSNTKTQLLKT